MKVWVKVNSDGKVIETANSEAQARGKETQRLYMDKESFMELITDTYSAWELAEMIFEKTLGQIDENFRHDLDLESLGWQEIEIKI
ncbi:MAG: hypothetical protein LIO71_03180 [Ruminococcus sp.]|nr:hypothetical protein [Ruminococcus sp.]